ncbi:unnamed protein product [Adineta ricciae]|uniref:Uncharacterized protein n=1 Tax=Adineta ricciae TaxID=249248 RepID=A0A815QRZ8_ADIRI|nr:unnamed protein product [Adineta ricciae]CAF1650676.1 unnamed protein product [Adineta ricciae]
MARSVPVGSSNVGSSYFPTVSCKLRAGNGQELIGYFLCNFGRNPAARNLPELAGIGENCAGIEKSCTGTDSGFNGSSRRNDRPGNDTICRKINNCAGDSRKQISQHTSYNITCRSTTLTSVCRFN